MHTSDLLQYVGSRGVMDVVVTPAQAKEQEGVISVSKLEINLR